MKTKIDFDKVALRVVVALSGGFLTCAGFEFVGIELLLAGIVMALLIEGAITMMFYDKWLGLVYHLLWAGVFCWRYAADYDLLGGWQWYVLWGVLIARIAILQPIYLKKMSEEPNK